MRTRILLLISSVAMLSSCELISDFQDNHTTTKTLEDCYEFVFDMEGDRSVREFIFEKCLDLIRDKEIKSARDEAVFLPFEDVVALKGRATLSNGLFRVNLYNGSKFDLMEVRFIVRLFENERQLELYQSDPDSVSSSSERIVRLERDHPRWSFASYTVSFPDHTSHFSWSVHSAKGVPSKHKTYLEGLGLTQEELELILSGDMDEKAEASD